jgi:HSP20 family protein
MFYVANPRHLAHTLRAFESAYANACPADEAVRSPALDLSEDDQGYIVELEMPGVSKTDVKVNIEGRRVKIEAAAPQNASETRTLYRERQAARYSRSFTLPQEINQEASEARFENGVLVLKLAKRQAAGGSLTIN